MPIGYLDLTDTLDRFRTAVDTLVAQTWSGNAAAKLAMVAEPALKALDSAGVPRPKLDVADVGHGLGAIFDPREWTISASERLFPAGALTEDGKRHRAALLYHEARHAEQFFLAARAIAGKTTPTVRDTYLQERLDAGAWAAARRSPYRPAAADARTIQAWIDEYPEARKVEDNLTLATSAVAEVVRDLTAARVPSFNSEEDRTAARRSIATLAEKMSRLRDWYPPALAKYGALLTEQDAYSVATKVGGVDAPRAEAYPVAVRAMADLEAAYKARSDEYRARVAAATAQAEQAPPA
jgi:hypothetical protein